MTPFLVLFPWKKINTEKIFSLGSRKKGKTFTVKVPQTKNVMEISL